MPEHLKSLVVIFSLASIVFISTEHSCLKFANRTELRKWRNLWLSTTLAAFLTYSFWLYAVLTMFALMMWGRRYPNKGALFLLLLFVIPPGDIRVPGFGLVNYLFVLNQPNLLALLLLLPCFLSFNREVSNGAKVSDALFLSYILLIVILRLRATTITDTARFAFDIFLDAVLPYFVFSRSLRNFQEFRQVILCFVLACMIISLVAIFEFNKGWLVYVPLPDVLGLDFRQDYLGRADLLRASGPTGHAIVLGYTIMVGIGFYLFLMNSLDGALQRWIGLVLLFGGLIVSLSRGPWLGTILLVVVFISTGRDALRRLVTLGLAGGLVLFILTIVPGGHRALDLLPYIGTVEAGSIEFRNRLIDNSLVVIQRNLLFGSVDYLQAPEMQALNQGGTLIDVVNSYIGIALASGIVGLSLFVAFFASALVGVWRGMASVVKSATEEHLLGRALFASLIAVLFTIATVSSIFNIPIIYWSISGICVAYARMVGNTKSHPGPRFSQSAIRG